jgi:hypothetical protein
LKEIGLESGSNAWARFHLGPIRGLTPVEDEVQVAVYAEDGVRGWLFLAERDPNGKISPIRNAYRLTRQGSEWTADEGNGGLGTYNAMTKFATRLFKYRRFRVKLEAASCR